MAQYPKVSAPPISQAPEEKNKKIIGWGNTVLKDDNTPLTPEPAPKYTPQVFKDSETYKEDVELDRHGSGVVSNSDMNNTQQPAYNPNSVHGKIYNNPSPKSGAPKSPYKYYQYSMKEWVICTKLNPPGSEEHNWQPGRVCELMMDKLIRVKLMSGKKIQVDPLKGQVRPLSEEEIAEVKKEHKSEEIPLFFMICCCPCFCLIAPLYFCGCVQVSGIVDCADCLCSGECCEEMSELCEATCQCLTCGLCF